MDLYISKEMQERADRARAQMQKAIHEDKVWETGCSAAIWFCNIVFVATGLYLYFTR